MRYLILPISILSLLSTTISSCSYPLATIRYENLYPDCFKLTDDGKIENTYVNQGESFCWESGDHYLLFEFPTTRSPKPGNTRALLRSSGFVLNPRQDTTFTIRLTSLDACYAYNISYKNSPNDPWTRVTHTARYNRCHY